MQKAIKLVTTAKLRKYIYEIVSKFNKFKTRYSFDRLDAAIRHVKRIMCLYEVLCEAADLEVVEVAESLKMARYWSPLHGRILTVLH